ncbi:MAG: DUF3084 domain-containing protein [Fimbriimonadaceae bacterium]|nr:DUF3084 domain-containing protein [Fimbriimonadaceae bacterium]
MDPFGIGFGVLAALGGGLIAYFADRLGRTIGKKRKSLFGLRPRHTAEVLIVGAGVLIPLFTIALVMIMSASVRRWFLEGPGAIAERDELRSEVGQLNADRQRLAGDILSGRTELTKLTGELERSKLEVGKAEDRAQELEGQVRRRESNMRQLDAKLRTASKKAFDTQKLVELRQGDLARLQVSFRTLNDDINAEFKRNIQLQRENSSLERSVSELDGQIASLRGELDRLERDNRIALDQKSGLERSLSTLAEDFERLKRESQSELEQNRLQLDRVSEQLTLKQEQLQRLIGRVDANLQIVRTRPLAFHIDEELARYPVAASQSAAEARAALQSVFAIAETTARGRGARGETAGGPVAGLMPLQVDDRTVTVDDQMTNLTEGVAGKGEELALVAYAAWNAFQGEFVPLVVRVFRNPVVFRQGEALTEVRIDGARPEGDVIQEIAEGLLAKVRERAQAAKMIPRQGSDQPYGAVSTQELLSLVRQVKAEGRNVRVQVLAAKETRAADALRLEFRLR